MRAACACGGPLTVWLSWPDVPLANHLRAPGDPPAPRHDLTIGRCYACGTSALMTPIPPRDIFPSTGYPYRSGVAAPFVRHAELLASEVASIAPPGRVLDIGGNDGTVAEAFRARDREAWVVDPCVPTAEMRGFFPEITAPLASGSIAAITALNVFAHIPDPLAFAEEVKRLLMPNGVFVLEVLWIGDVVATGALDTLYHEHWWHWSLEGLVTVLAQAGLYVHRAEHLPVQGGSVRVWARPKRGTAPTWDEGYLCDAAIYRAAHAKWNARIERLQGWLATRRWAGYAATAKSTLLAHAARLGPETLAYVIDETPEKQGKLTPYDVPIVSRDTLKTDPVDGLVLFAPAYAATLQQNLRDDGWDGPVVVA